MRMPHGYDPEEGDMRYEKAAPDSFRAEVDGFRRCQERRAKRPAAEHPILWIIGLVAATGILYACCTESRSDPPPSPGGLRPMKKLDPLPRWPW
ncbi:MAG: hypothetical protein HY744_26980 [Deltaproteobacteria bacterium]|nr:hypothetical protein [Deltaproteobacteria bacterium]